MKEVPRQVAQAQRIHLLMHSEGYGNTAVVNAGTFLLPFLEVESFTFRPNIS
jgi:hypothetical protein